jgi:hypothetical protein
MIKSRMIKWAWHAGHIGLYSTFLFNDAVVSRLYGTDEWFINEYGEVGGIE